MSLKIIVSEEEIDQVTKYSKCRRRVGIVGSVLWPLGLLFLAWTFKLALAHLFNNKFEEDNLIVWLLCLIWTIASPCLALGILFDELGKSFSNIFYQDYLHCQKCDGREILCDASRRVEVIEYYDQVPDENVTYVETRKCANCGYIWSRDLGSKRPSYIGLASGRASLDGPA
ncbi:MAG: hypothetical protein M1429_04105 [Patescibacteria group bacterium]|nr:hypothetical protein [Patescibacteria group bacterium]